MNKTVIYLGLNDKNTKKQLIKTSDAIKILTELTSLPMTITKATGVWQGETENTLVLTLYNNAPLPYIKILCQDIGARFNQYSVFLEYNNFKDTLFVDEVVIEY